MNQSLLEQTRERHHPLCVVCGQGDGLAMQFAVQPDGSVEAKFDCPDSFQGYKGQLHGGIISSLLDGAMTNCLFARGIDAATAELIVRFRHPVTIGVPLTVVGKISRSRPPLHFMEAQVLQGQEVMACATAKFMERRMCPGTAKDCKTGATAPTPHER